MQVKRHNLSPVTILPFAGIVEQNTYKGQTVLRSFVSDWLIGWFPAGLNYQE